jgi:hypothetical protein
MPDTEDLDNCPEPLRPARQFPRVPTRPDWLPSLSPATTGRPGARPSYFNTGVTALRQTARAEAESAGFGDEVVTVDSPDPSAVPVLEVRGSPLSKPFAFAIWIPTAARCS